MLEGWLIVFEHSSGIELILETRVMDVDVKHKTLLTATGETITYKFLIIATGARVMKLILTHCCSFFNKFLLPRMTLFHFSF